MASFGRKDGKMLLCHCIMHAGMRKTCNHDVAMFSVKAEARLRLTNLPCTSTVNGWLPYCKEVVSTEIKAF